MDPRGDTTRFICSFHNWTYSNGGALIGIPQKNHFGAVAKSVAVATREAALDVLSMAKTSTKVFVLEVMGYSSRYVQERPGTT